MIVAKLRGDQDSSPMLPMSAELAIPAFRKSLRFTIFSPPCGVQIPVFGLVAFVAGHMDQDVHRVQVRKPALMKSLMHPETGQVCNLRYKGNDYLRNGSVS